MALDNTVGDGGARHAIAGSILRYGWPSREWNGTIYLPKTFDVDSSGRPNDTMLLPTISAQTNQSFLRTQPIRVVESGVASFSNWKPLPWTYVASRVDTLQFGIGVATPQLLYAALPGAVGVQLGLSGELGEFTSGRGSMRYQLFDRDGRLLSTTNDVMRVDFLQPHRLEIDAEQTHWVGSREGRAHVSASFGGASADKLPPRMTSVAVFDAWSRLVDSIGKSTAARLRFSALDLADGTEALQHVNTAATKVWVRLEGTTEWRPLQPLIQAEDFEPRTVGDPPRGTIFECALSEVTESEGLYDLRIDVEDPTGNSTETILQPAFEVVGAPKRTRPVRK